MKLGTKDKFTANLFYDFEKKTHEFLKCHILVLKPLKNNLLHLGFFECFNKRQIFIIISHITPSQGCTDGKIVKEGPIFTKSWGTFLNLSLNPIYLSYDCRKTRGLGFHDFFLHALVHDKFMFTKNKYVPKKNNSVHISAK